jgi:splicing factor 3B subunit 2
MGKSLQDENGVSDLVKALEEKKRLLLGGVIENGNGMSMKKLTREEKEKIKRAIKKKQKKIKKKQHEDDEDEEEKIEEAKYNAVPKPETESNIEVEYVEKDEYLLTGKYYDEFKNVFQYFAAPQQPINLNKQQTEKVQEDEDQEEGKNEPEDKPLSKKKLKALKRLRVAQLKALVKRPDVVEV